MDIIAPIHLRMPRDPGIWSWRPQIRTLGPLEMAISWGAIWGWVDSAKVPKKGSLWLALLTHFGTPENPVFQKVPLSMAPLEPGSSGGLQKRVQKWPILATLGCAPGPLHSGNRF